MTEKNMMLVLPRLGEQKTTDVLLYMSGSIVTVYSTVSPAVYEHGKNMTLKELMLTPRRTVLEKLRHYPHNWPETIKIIEETP